MNQQTFVGAVRRHVRDAAVDGVVSLLERPAGRRPAPDLLELSGWYESLSSPDRDRLRRVLALMAHQVTFGVFAVLDGARAIETASAPKGRFELRYVSPSGEVTMIAGDGAALLHEAL